MAAPEQDPLNRMRARRRTLEDRIAARELEAANAQLATAQRELDQHMDSASADPSRASSLRNSTGADYLEYERLITARDVANDRANKRRYERDEMSAELAALAGMLDAVGEIKTLRHQLDDAIRNEQAAKETLTGHSALAEALPSEVETLRTKRRALINQHAKDEVKARTSNQPSPKFPSGISEIDTAIESKLATLAAASETRDVANEAIRPAKAAVDAARTRLRGALHQKALLDFTLAVANSGLSQIAATLLTAEGLGSEDTVEIRPTVEELAAARKALAEVLD